MRWARGRTRARGCRARRWRPWWCLTGALVLSWLPLVPASASNDPFFDSQWALAQVHAPDAWPVDTGAGVTIGIVDTGVESSHPDLAGRIGATTACINTGGDPSKCAGTGDDIDGHGTHVTGIAVADAGNGIGIAGVAPAARVVVARVFQNTSNGMAASVADVNAGIQWVVGQGARVVNLSLGLDPNRPPPSSFLTLFGGQTLGTGIEWAWSHGAVPVLAAGNDSNGQVDYPNAHAIIVGASRRNGDNASYSTSLANARWGIVAPGGENSQADEGVVSTWTQGRYAYLAGTSMAVPHVSGAVALMLSKGLGPTDAVQRILATVDHVNCGAGCQGRLDVAQAVGVTPTTPGTTPPVTSGSGSSSSSGSRARRSPAPAQSGPAVVVAAPTTAPDPAGTSTTETSTEPPTSAPSRRRSTVALTVRPDDSGRPGRVAADVTAVALLALTAGGVGMAFRRRRGA